MNAQRYVAYGGNRRGLYQRAMQTSIRVRIAAGLDLASPICIYGLCKARGVTVRFNAINMEGMYDRAPKHRIHLSALRPLVRRSFNCAHELGHHEFGHGSTIDELREDSAGHRWDQPDEVLADAFGAFTLMPTLGLRQAFAQRGLTVEKATVLQLYVIACAFGVGLRTLITHLTFGIEEMSRFRFEALKRSSPTLVRTEFLGRPTKEPLIVVDPSWNAPSLDAEEGHLIWLPANVSISGTVLVAEGPVRGGMLYRAVAPGIGRAAALDRSWATYVRVARREYIGLAEYRHLEETSDE